MLDIFKILDYISDLFQIKFKEVTKYNEITFDTSSNKIKNINSKRYNVNVYHSFRFSHFSQNG